MICGHYNCPSHFMKIIKLIAPEQMSALQRAAEITTILSAAIMRTHASGQAATDQKQRRIQLGFSGHQSVHTNPYQQRSSK